MVKNNFIHIILTIIINIWKMHIYQFDICITFLNGDLSKEIYMAQPKGCVQPKVEKMVCKLFKKSIWP
jgi:hypothetical protein